MSQVGASLNKKCVQEGLEWTGARRRGERVDLKFKIWDLKTERKGRTKTEDDDEDEHEMRVWCGHVRKRRCTPHSKTWRANQV